MSRRDHDDDELERRFDGREALEKLLTRSGSVADAEDVAEAFRLAVKDGVPPAVVIQALWEDEPRFESPRDARALFANLFGLYDLVASGASIDLGARSERTKREKAARPEPFGEAGPDDTFVEAAWRFLDDHPKEREKLAHAFDNRQDALVSWLDASGLGDDAFALARRLLDDVFAMLELGGRTVATVAESKIPAQGGALPAPLAAWIDEGVFEAEQDEGAPLSADEAAKVRELVTRGALALWTAAQ